MGTSASTPDATAIRTATEDHRFAELAARTGLEPELAQRYATDPVSVLAEFGMSAAESHYMSAPAGDEQAAILAEFGLSAAEPLYMGASLVIEDLYRPAPAGLASPTWTYIPEPGPDTRSGVASA
ncbi:hypothetical protein [Streptomyces sp. H27-D2]|uniref:hypothetical protein n=1 Tax=Streptomyces sp. H27-D2 TaxID=3046304 RepID=UPI002DB8634C|nr:hypothetical protein [Streptomyces sp. H27-D2]